MNDDKFFLAALGGATGLGNKSIALLVKSFGNAKAAWFAGFDDLKRTGVRKNALAAFIEFRTKNPDAPEKLADYCDRQKIGVCSIFDEDYPPLLKRTPFPSLKKTDNPPVFFYYRGKLKAPKLRIAVVGSRQSTSYGEKVAFEFAEQLAAAGVTVVSGAARGIDTFAHLGALKSGRTVAVLGCGLDFNLPRDRTELLDRIAENGVVISEFNPKSAPSAGTLAARNRVIAGLSGGIIVVEAGIKSGALIAAKHAEDYDRAVFAVPGPVDADVSAGCNNLIREGAYPLTCIQDIIDGLSHG